MTGQPISLPTPAELRQDHRDRMDDSRTPKPAAKAGIRLYRRSGRMNRDMIDLYHVDGALWGCVHVDAFSNCPEIYRRLRDMAGSGIVELGDGRIV